MIIVLSIHFQNTFYDPQFEQLCVTSQQPNQQVQKNLPIEDIELFTA